MNITIQEIRFGVEIETVGKTRREVADAIRTVVGGTVQHVASPACYDPYHVTDARGLVWKVVADSSLTNVPADLRAEIVTPILAYDDIPLLQDVVRAVRQAGARCDEQCGLHLHLSHPAVTPKALANLAKTMYKQEELIYAALGVTRERMERYCRPLNTAFIDRITHTTPKTFQQLNRMWYGLCGTLHNPYYVAPRIMWRHRSHRIRLLRIVPHNTLPDLSPVHPVSTSTPPFMLVLRRKSSLSLPGTGLSSAFE